MGADDRMATGHPTGEQLIAFAGREADTAADAAMANHIRECAECAGAVTRFGIVRDVLSASREPEPPAALLTQAKALFANSASGEATLPADVPRPLRRVIAELIFDSGAGMAPALAGFRGAGERHLTYVADAVQIDLRVRPPVAQDGAWHVLGQVDADKLTPATAVDMVPSGTDEAVARATTDAHGMFDLSAPSGRYDLLIRLPCALQVLPGLVLG